LSFERGTCKLSGIKWFSLIPGIICSHHLKKKKKKKKKREREEEEKKRKLITGVGVSSQSGELTNGLSQGSGPNSIQPCSWCLWYWGFSDLRVGGSW